MISLDVSANELGAAGALTIASVLETHVSGECLHYFDTEEAK